MSSDLEPAISVPPYLRTAGERQSLLEEFVVDHDRSREAIEFVGQFHYPVKGGHPSRGRLAVLAGDSRTGKTFSVKRYLKSHPASVGTCGKVFPVVYCEMPALNAERGILAAIAVSLEISFTSRTTNYNLFSAIVTSLRERQVELFLFDEFQDVFDPKKPQLVNFARRFIRKLLNIDELPPNVLCIGLEHTYRMMREDGQLVGRGGMQYKIMRPYEWETKEEKLLFRYLCGEIDKILPFETSSGLERNSIAERLYWVTSGNLGFLKDFLKSAGYRAINDGAPCIESKHFEIQWDAQKPLDVTFNPFRDDMASAPPPIAPQTVVQAPLTTSETYSVKRRAQK